MRKWLGAMLGVYGYAEVIWYHSSAFFPAPDLLRRLLWNSCVACTAVTRPGGPPWAGIVFILAPANLLIYSTFGFLLGLIVDRCWPSRARDEKN